MHGNLRLLTMAAILSAMSIILGKYLQIPNPLQELVRISFENMPVILAGIVMGPVMGAVVGVIADLVGCFLVGYAVNPIVTLGAAVIGFVAGLSARYLFKRYLVGNILLSVFLAHGLGSIVIKSWGLAQWYAASYHMGFLTLVGWRAVSYGIVAVLEVVIICVLLKNSALRRVLERMCERK